jgi:putative photosynthetic complex assembly protein 2
VNGQATMMAHGSPVLIVLALWWASTGLILYLDSREKRTFGFSMLAASALAALALGGIAATATITTAAAAYAAFACGLALWGWQLLAFYTGFFSGPRRVACAPGSSGFARFRQGVGASLYHEVAAAAGAAVLAALTFGQPNRVALWTYLVLWGMHESAKLNLFFGVPNLGEGMLPQHLAYLTSYMRRGSMTLFFPVSVSAATVVAVLLHQYAAREGATPFEATSGAMLTALMALAILEHWFLVAPIDASALWRAFLRTPKSPSRAGSEPCATNSPQGNLRPPTGVDPSRGRQPKSKPVTSCLRAESTSG